MFAHLKNHPFAVNAFLQKSVVLTYALPIKDLVPLLPPPFLPDTFEDQTGFVAVAMVQTTGLRPAGFPSVMGNNFFLIGYRIFIRYRNTAGRNLRGLFILRSETDSHAMKMLGSVFTKYKYDKIDIFHGESDGAITVSSGSSSFRVKAEVADDGSLLPAGSPFSSWKEARRFAGPLPFTFSFDNKKNEVLIVQGVREHWVPVPLQILEHNIPFLDQPAFRNKSLASAFVIRDIPYRWEKGKIEKWSE